MHKRNLLTLERNYRDEPLKVAGARVVREKEYHWGSDSLANTVAGLKMNKVKLSGLWMYHDADKSNILMTLGNC